jgi:hypothetical protein
MFFRVLATVMFGLWAAGALALIIGALRNQSDDDTLMLLLGLLLLGVSITLWLLVMRLVRGAR